MLQLSNTTGAMYESVKLIASTVSDELVCKFEKRSFHHFLHTVCGHDGWKKLKAQQLHHKTNWNNEQDSHHKTNDTHANHLYMYEK